MSVRLERLTDRRLELQRELEAIDRELLDLPCPMTVRCQNLSERRGVVTRELRELESRLVELEPPGSH